MWKLLTLSVKAFGFASSPKGGAKASSRLAEAESGSALASPLGRGGSALALTERAGDPNDRSITMKKKLIALLAAVAMVFSLAACGSTPDSVGTIGTVDITSGLYLLAQYDAYQKAADLASSEQDATDVRPS